MRKEFVHRTREKDEDVEIAKEERDKARRELDEFRTEMNTKMIQLKHMEMELEEKLGRVADGIEE